jgi:RimJ/RimL family protein N-acetyltransferase
MDPILVTERLELRELTAEDVPFLTGLLTDPQVMYAWPRPYTSGEVGAWIDRQRERYRRDGCGYWLASDRRLGLPVGQAGLMRSDVAGTSQLGLGYIFDRAHWGRGYASEAARGCVSYAFERLGQQRVIALIRPENGPSRAVAGRLGMRLVGETLHAELLHMIYAIDRSEWKLGQDNRLASPQR